MYLETIRDVKRFIATARTVSKIKPLVVHKAGRTLAGSRAASSHTGALAGKKELFDAVLNQSGAIISPTMEILLPLTHALAERPPMKGKRIGVVTMGGSWGVALTDSLEEEGLIVPELSAQLQARLRSLGMPVRASTKNPVDIGASGIVSVFDTMSSIGKEILASGEVDALVLHGLGRPGNMKEDAKIEDKFYFEFEMKAMKEYNSLEKEFNIPVLIANHYRTLESQANLDLIKEGIRVYSRLDEIAQILSRMYTYWAKRHTEK
jgi:acyl-CoA synthetase (NDP forming)